MRLRLLIEAFKERLRKIMIDMNASIDKIISTTYVEIVGLRPLVSIDYRKDEEKWKKKRKNKEKEKNLRRRRFQNVREKIEKHLPVLFTRKKNKILCEIRRKQEMRRRQQDIKERQIKQRRLRFLSEGTDQATTTIEVPTEDEGHQ